MMMPHQSLDGIRAWMNDEFKPAKTRLQEEGTPEVYSFQVEQGAPSPTLCISQEVFDHHPVDEIIAALDHDHVAAKLRGDGPADEPGPARDGDRQGRVRDAGGSEDGVDRRGAVAEHPLQGRPHDAVVESVAETAERQLVDDLVVDARAGLDRAERVAMLPAPEWSAELHVGEAVRRIADVDARAPGRPDARERSDRVVDDQARPHRPVGAADDDPELGRHDPSEVLRPGEEAEDLIDRPRDGLTGAERVRAGHGLILVQVEPAPAHGAPQVGTMLANSKPIRALPASPRAAAPTARPITRESDA